MIATVIRAELFHVRHRPGVWLAGAFWVVQIAVFAYIVAYISFGSFETDPEPGMDLRTLYDRFMPREMAATVLSSHSFAGAAVPMIIGVLLAGTEYRLNMQGMVFTQRPGRLTLLTGKLVTLAIVLLAVVLAGFVAAAGASSIIAGAEDRAVVWPATGDLLIAIGGSWLSAMAFGSAGFALAVLFRGVTAALAVSLVWALLVENTMIGGIAAAIPALSWMPSALIGPNTGALAASIGGPAQPIEGSFVGAAADSGPVLATAVLCLYVLAAVVLSAVLLRRRDIT